MASRKRGINPSKIQDFRGGSTYTGTGRIEQERERIREGREASFPTTSLSEIPWVPGNNHPPDESSRVRAFKYIPTNPGEGKFLGDYYGTIFVRFIKKGTPWKYTAVPQTVYEQFFSSPSKGSFINAALNQYPYSEATADEIGAYFQDM